MISSRLTEVIRRELALEDFEITGEMTASDIPGWDSLNHIRVIGAIEEEFGVRLRSRDLLRFRNVADLQRLVDDHCGGR